MKVIIAGSRDFDDEVFVVNTLDALFYVNDSIEEVVSGGARGPDQLGETWARYEMLPVKQFIPDWNPAPGVTDKGAGYKRNAEMADYADCLVAFWDGKSNGTKHMIDQALSKGLETHVYIV
jgi:hypothetical protein